MKFGIGQPVKRFEDVRLVTGRGCYTDDVVPPGTLSAYILRSQVAHARLLAVDTTAAGRMPGVHLILTGADVTAEQLGDVICQYPLNNRDGTSRHDTPRPVLCVDRIRYVGEPVALIIADTLAQARDAAEAISVSVDDLPAVVTAGAALRPGSPKLFEHIQDNIVFDWDNDTSDIAATNLAFSNAAHIVKIEIVNNRVSANPMEPRNAVAEFDSATDHSTLHTASQGPHWVRDPIADTILKIPREKLRVVTPNVGGGFGMKAFVYPEQALVVWASRKVKQPVKWQEDRSEAFLSDNHGRDHETKAELALDREGHILGLRVNVLANLGAYLSPMGAYVPTRSSDLYPGLYRTPAVHINIKGVSTNTAPVCAYRGAGRPEAAYLMERLIDKAARVLGMSVDAIRRLNLIPPSAIPFRNATGLVIDSGEFEHVMQLCMEKADWYGFQARRKKAHARGKLRGIGMSVYTERCGAGWAETAIIEFKEDHIELVMGNVEYGTGVGTSYKQIIADQLGIHPDKVQVILGDTDRTPFGLAGGSRALAVGGSAILGASAEVIKKGRALVSELMEVGEQDVEFSEATFRIAGTDRLIGLFELAKVAANSDRLPSDAPRSLDSRYERVPEAPTYPNGCHIVELEIDPRTGFVRIDRYTAVDDFGVTINPIMLEGQVHGGIAQGVGQALFENIIYDEGSGQLITGSFQDYQMPRATDFPSFAIELHNFPCKTNPLGVKGAGEAGAVGAPPAVMNAVVDAIHPALGLIDIDMPATPSKMWQLLNRSELSN